jgi:hypothetical protein
VFLEGEELLVGDAGLPVNDGSNWKAEAQLILVNLSSSFIGSPMHLATGPPLYDGVPRSSLLCSRPGSVF